MRLLTACSAPSTPQPGIKVCQTRQKAACIYHWGTYESIDTSYRKLLSFCRENGLEILSDAYEFCINDYISSGDENEYITEIFSMWGKFEFDELAYCRKFLLL